MANEPNVEQPTSESPTENEITTQEEEQSPSVEESDAVQKRLRNQSKKIKTIAEERDYWRGVAARQAQLDRQRIEQNPPVPSSTNQYTDEEVDRAYRTLADKGMVTREELEAREREMKMRFEWDRQHDRNEQSISKSKYLPEYDRDEVEEYAREKGISDPMAAYRDMYFDEILDAVKKGGGGKRTTSSTTNQRPSKPTNEAREPLTLDSFREKISDPDYYDKLASDPKKFDELLSQLSEE